MFVRQWKFTEQTGLKTHEELWVGGVSLPYPFTGLEDVVLSSVVVKLFINIGNSAYELKDAHVDVAPQHLEAALRMQLSAG